MDTKYIVSEAISRLHSPGQWKLFLSVAGKIAQYLEAKKRI